MASGHVNRIQKAEHMAAPTNAANVKKVLANSEPSTHGTAATCGHVAAMSGLVVKRTSNEADLRSESDPLRILQRAELASSFSVLPTVP